MQAGGPLASCFAIRSGTMEQPARVNGYRWLGDKRSQIVYDLHNVNDESVINELIESGQYLVFGPDSLAEARNRGYRYRRG